MTSPHKQQKKPQKTGGFTSFIDHVAQAETSIADGAGKLISAPFKTPLNALSNAGKGISDDINGWIGSIEKGGIILLVGIGAIVYLNRNNISNVGRTVYADASNMGRTIYSDAKTGASNLAPYAPLAAVALL